MSFASFFAASLMSSHVLATAPVRLNQTGSYCVTATRTLDEDVDEAMMGTVWIMDF